MAELDPALGITATLDTGIGPVKERATGAGAKFALAMAAMQLTLAARLGQVQRESSERVSAQVAACALAALPIAERARVLSRPVTIDLDDKRCAALALMCRWTFPLSPRPSR